MNQSRYLITTADETSWKFDQPVLFLGEWCRRYNRKSVWSNMDAVTMGPYGLDRKQQELDQIYLKSLTSQLLSELTVSLNEFHNTNYSQKYWHIILGPFLVNFIPLIWDRWETIRNLSDIKFKTIIF